MAGIVASLHPGSAALVTWAPTSRARRQQRGFDHAELLARAVAREARLPVRRTLVRVGSAVQTGHSRADRLGGPTFRLDPAAPELACSTVVLVDDVVTTGATLAAAGRVLNSAGAQEVVGLAAARTPAHFARARRHA